MTHRSTRSPLARAVGLGTAKSGTEHWWTERISAVALVPLTIWLVISLIAHSRSDYAGFLAWLRNPGVTIAMSLLLMSLFHHAALGLEVIVEDYVHSAAKYAAIIAIRLCCFALAVAGVIATLEIALAG